MDIRLENIGIIKNSTIELNGLTVITGENNSGKTTVGKVIYSLVDSVLNLSEKAEYDQCRFVANTLDYLQGVFQSFFRYLSKIKFLTFFGENSKIYQLINNDWDYFSFVYYKKTYMEYLEFSRELQIELKRFSLGLSDYNLDSLIENKSFFLKYDGSSEKMKKDFQNIVNDVIAMLDMMFEKLESDIELINYARGSIEQTLNVEFHGQIQPVLNEVESSQIEVIDNGTIIFRVEIQNNKVLKKEEPVFYSCPYRKALFIDNPFILDSPLYSKTKSISFANKTFDDSYLDKARIIKHEDKLRNLLRAPARATVLETLIADEKYAEINTKIREVIAGNIEFNTEGEFYVIGDKKLHFSNLATGSKIFSILKILIDKGQIDKDTLLVLDEPEAHLHPKWQNQFAEIIVLLVKYLDIDVLLTSHSPNFVMAIDAYMRKYEIIDKVNFYQTIQLDGGFVEYNNVNDDLGKIYADFTQYLADVKVLRDFYLNGDNYD